MSKSSLADLLGQYATLDADEETALAALETEERSWRKGAVIRREHEAAQDLFIVRSGWAFSCVIMPDGGRQILRLHFPGDVVGLSALAFSRASATLMALTDVTLAAFDRQLLVDMFAGQPRLGMLLFAYAQIEHIALNDRLASIGRTSARARVAALLLETAHRLRPGSALDGQDFAFPLTQEEIGDATGLTAVHVNRMLRTLEYSGLVSRQGGRIRILDERRLIALACYENRQAGLAMDWLPQARLRAGAGSPPAAPDISRRDRHS